MDMMFTRFLMYRTDLEQFFEITSTTDERLVESDPALSNGDSGMDWNKWCMTNGHAVDYRYQYMFPVSNYEVDWGQMMNMADFLREYSDSLGKFRSAVRKELQEP